MTARADAARITAKFSQLPKKVKDAVDKSTKQSGDELVRIAKVLVPVKTGASRAAINAKQNADGSVLVDFGPKAKVIEGEGGGPQPFVNPALAVTRKKHSARARRAATKAAKAVMNG